MSTILRICICQLLIMVAACTPSSRSTGNQNKTLKHTVELQPTQVNAISENSSGIQGNILPDGQTPSDLVGLPVSERGEIILSEGYYEADFKSYCLQPGTPDPTSRDAYLQSPLSGPRSEILETALRNSLDKPYLDQKNIQLLLWSVVSGSDYNRLSSEVKYTARQLLTPQQIFQLKGGVMSVVKTVANYIPDNQFSNSYNQMRNLFELGQSSYEVYEQLAVLRQPSIIKHPDYKRDQWYRHPDGYFLRYFPKGYQLVHAEVYVPKGLLDADGKRNGQYLLFDPVRMMAVPANSNAQRLGIGAPVADILRTVIQIHQQQEVEKKRRKTQKPVYKPVKQIPTAPVVLH